MTTPEVLLDGLAFPEGPRWHEGRLWFSDMHDQRVLALDESGGVEEIVRVEQRPSGLGWLPDGRLLVVSMWDRKLLRLDPDGLAVHADLSGLATFHCNDMVVDARGRAYVGNFGFDLDAGDTPREAELILVHPDGRAEIAAEKLRFPNGTVITPDGRTLIVGESFGACLTAFDIADDGSLSGQRTWAKLEGAVPDGICLDSEGAIWVASPVSNEVLRVREGGEVTSRIATDRMAIACMLGGDDGRTLFILTAETTHAEEAPKLRSARIERARVEVAHAGLP
jgi:sugar lactone lactonase YvrE